MRKRPAAYFPSSDSPFLPTAEAQRGGRRAWSLATDSSRPHSCSSRTGVSCSRSVTKTPARAKSSSCRTTVRWPSHFSPCTRVANLKSILNAGGISWSNGVWDLHRGGLYASSVPVGDDEVVTAYSCATDSQSMCPERGGKLSECLAVLVACGFSTSLIAAACVLCSDAAVETAGVS